jgi:glycosyltransferase involved in cell wall biosynthesis
MARAKLTFGQLGTPLTVTRSGPRGGWTGVKGRRAAMDSAGLLSVVMPVYHEAGTVGTIVEQVLAVPLSKELIVVDDGSTDGTSDVLRRLRERYGDEELRVLRQPHNRGKGTALRRGISVARGEYVVIQDGDLEYDPHDYPSLFGAASRSR